MTRSRSALAGPVRRQWQRECGLAELFASHCLQEASDSLTEPSLVCCRGGRMELQLLTYVHKYFTKDLTPGFLSCRDPASRNQSADKNLLSSSTLWCWFFFFSLTFVSLKWHFISCWDLVDVKLVSTPHINFLQLLEAYCHIILTAWQQECHLISHNSFFFPYYYRNVSWTSDSGGLLRILKRIWHYIYMSRGGKQAGTVVIAGWGCLW